MNDVKFPPFTPEEEDEIYRGTAGSPDKPVVIHRQSPRLPPFEPPELPSAEHRAHIRRFVGSRLTDAEDVALRGWVAFRRWLHKCTTEQEARERGADEDVAE